MNEKVFKRQTLFGLFVIIDEAIDDGGEGIELVGR